MSGVPAGLDFAAVTALAAYQGADLGLLADALPEVESVMLSGMAGELDEED